jgi:hypothetical protein
MLEYLGIWSRCIFWDLLPVYSSILCLNIPAFYAGLFGILFRHFGFLCWFLCQSELVAGARVYSHLMPVYPSLLCRFIHAFYAGLLEHFMPVRDWLQSSIGYMSEYFMPVYSSILFQSILSFYAGLFMHFLLVY